LRKAINENNIDSIALGMNKNKKEVIKIAGEYSPAIYDLFIVP